MISEDADLRKGLRQLMFDEGAVVSRKAMDAIDEQDKFTGASEPHQRESGNREQRYFPAAFVLSRFQ